MESTGKYWIPIYNVLETELNICLTHPKYVKAIKGKKTDKRDSKWICDLYKCDLVKHSFIPQKRNSRNERNCPLQMQTCLYALFRKKQISELFDSL